MKRVVAVLFLLVGGSQLGACSSSHSSPDANIGATLFGLCPTAGPPTAHLVMSVNGNVGYTVPVTAGQAQTVTLTVLNNGQAAATQMLDLTPPTPTLSYEGGAYPGTGGTCTAELAAGASCTLVATLVGPTTGRESSAIVIQYYDGVVYTTDTHTVVAVATPASFAPATHAPLATMPQHGGQPPIGNVHLVTVSFADTPESDAIPTFGAWVVTSSWWLSVGKDYGVGPGTHQHVVLTESTPTTLIDSDFAAYVDSSISSGTLPTAPSSVYMFFLSAATTVTDVNDAGGWHNRSPGGHDYAVILPGCSSAPSDVLATYTFVAGHELIESATDPTPLTGYNFGFGEGEVADVCDNVTVQDGYTLPTVWSNSAAATGGDPCVPATGEPYVDVDPVPASVSIAAAAGASVNVTLTGWSTMPVGDWLLQAAVVGGDAQAFTATLDPTRTDLVNNGQSVQLEVTTDGTAPAGTSAIVTVTSFAPSGAGGVAGFQLIPLTVAASAVQEAVVSPHR